MAAVLQRNESYGSVYFETATGLLSLEGRGVLVMGGATGVGAAVVTALADANAYVTIADSDAIQGQRLMLDLVSRNKRVQYLYTTLPSFPSQTAALRHAAAFAPTHALSLIISNTIPPSPSTSILTWLATTTATTPLPPPPTTPLDHALTATLHTAHLALHHFRSPAVATEDTPTGDDGDAHLLILAPQTWMPDEGEVPAEDLAARAAAGGLQAMVRGLREVVGGLGVRINVVGVEHGDEKEADREGEEDAAAAAAAKNAEEAEKYSKCVDAVVRVARDKSVSGRAFVVSWDGVRDVVI